MKLGDHDGSVHTGQDGRHRAVCSCGWESNRTAIRSDAEIALHDHVEKYTMHGDEGGRAL